jgi:hypothetical protein
MKIGVSKNKETLKSKVLTVRFLLWPCENIDWDLGTDGSPGAGQSRQK